MLKELLEGPFLRAEESMGELQLDEVVADFALLDTERARRSQR